MKKRIIIIGLLIIISFIGLIFLSINALDSQYNKNGISHFLVVTIDKSRPKTYIGDLENHKVYIEGLDINNTVFRNIDAENVSIKEAIDNKLVSIKEWRKYAFFKTKKNNKEILRFDNYQIIITKDECIIKSLSNKKVLTYDCEGNKKSIDLKKGNSFKCKLLSTNYKFKIKSIDKDKVIITVNDYGLAKVKEDKTIDLLSKEKEFTINKSELVEIRTQSMDYSESIRIEWR